MIPSGLAVKDPLNVVLNEWSEQTGAASRLVEGSAGPMPNAENRSATAASTPLPAGHSEAADLIIVPIMDLGELAAGDRLAPIPRPKMGGGLPAGWIDLFSGLRERVLSLGGSPTLIPFCCPVLTCYLRKDLLDKAGLKPPRTWDEYQVLVESSARWAPGLDVVEPWGEEFRATMFLARALSCVKHAGNYSVFFDIDTGAPLIDSPGFVRPLAQAMAALARMPAEVKHYAPADCRRQILAGKAAMAISFEPGRIDEKPIERGPGVAISFVRLPGSTQFYSWRTKAWESLPDGRPNYATLAPFTGLAAGVARGIPAARADAAWNLLLYLSEDRYEQALANVPKSVCRESQLSGSVPWLSPDLRTDELFGYLGATAESLRQTNISGELLTVGRSEFRSALTEELTKVMDGKAAPEAALKSVAARWTALSKSLGPDRVRDSYRKCLGLSPAIEMR